MNGRVAPVVELAAFLASPFLLWLALFVTAREWSLDLRPTLRWIRRLRHLTWGAGLLMLVIHFAYDRFPSFYGLGILSGSFALAFPEEWVKRRFAPDLVHNAESLEGWWPSKAE